MELPNLSYIESLSGGDKIFENKLVGIIKLEFSEEKSTYFKNFNKRDYIQASENVHKIKHKISILGLENSYALATDYENNLTDNDISLCEEFESILRNITDYLSQI